MFTISSSYIIKIASQRYFVKSSFFEKTDKNVENEKTAKDLQESGHGELNAEDTERESKNRRKNRKNDGAHDHDSDDHTEEDDGFFGPGHDVSLFVTCII